MNCCYFHSGCFDTVDFAFGSFVFGSWGFVLGVDLGLTGIVGCCIGCIVVGGFDCWKNYEDLLIFDSRLSCCRILFLFGHSCCN